MSGPWVVANLALWALVTVLALVVIGQLRGASSRLEFGTAGPQIPPEFGGLPVGSQVPDFSVVDASGRSLTRADLAGASVLVLVDAGCEPCDAFIGEVWEMGHDIKGVPIFLVTDETGEGGGLRPPPRANVLYQQNRSATRAFLNIASPQAFAIAMGRVVDKVIPKNMSDLRRLAVEVRKGGGWDEANVVVHDGSSA